MKSKERQVKVSEIREAEKGGEDTHTFVFQIS
jgi:hypothetical protein